jgi:hypothetical protein
MLFLALMHRHDGDGVGVHSVATAYGKPDVATLRSTTPLAATAMLAFLWSAPSWSTRCHRVRRSVRRPARATACSVARVQMTLSQRCCRARVSGGVVWLAAAARRRLLIGALMRM